MKTIKYISDDKGTVSTKTMRACDNMMTSGWSGIGGLYTGYDYNLMTAVLRNEWGFQGFVITDYDQGNGPNDNVAVNRMVRAGVDQHMIDKTLSPGKYTSTDTATGVTALRRAIKDTLYTLERLLKNKKLAERYLGGYAVILRLTVDDYHHYCYVADGEKSPDVKIPGVFHTVNPAANDVCQIYHENTREYCLLKTEQFGTIAMMEVGAMMVGKITNLKPGACEVKKGEEKGYFEFGGSTIVLLLQHGKVRLDSDLIENSENGYETIVRMGERIGKCKLPKRA